MVSLPISFERTAKLFGMARFKVFPLQQPKLALQPNVTIMHFLPDYFFQTNHKPKALIFPLIDQQDQV